VVVNQLRGLRQPGKPSKRAVLHHRCRHASSTVSETAPDIHLVYLPCLFTAPPGVLRFIRMTSSRSALADAVQEGPPGFFGQACIETLVIDAGSHTSFSDRRFRHHQPFARMLILGKPAHWLQDCTALFPVMTWCAQDRR
jgi:hypothetical protein